MTQSKKYTRNKMMEDLCMESSIGDKIKEGLSSFKTFILGKSRPKLREMSKEIEAIHRRPVKDPNKKSKYKYHKNWEVLLSGTNPVSDLKTKLELFRGLSKFSISEGETAYREVERKMLKKTVSDVPAETLSKSEADRLYDIIKQEVKISGKAFENLIEVYVEMKSEGQSPKGFKEYNTLVLVHYDLISAYMDLVLDSYRTLTK